MTKFVNISGAGWAGCSALSEFLLDYEDCYSMGSLKVQFFVEMTGCLSCIS